MPGEPNPEHGATPEIDALYAEWRDAFRRADVEAAMDLLTSDYALWPAGRAPLSADQIRPQMQAAFASHEIDSTFERVECLRSGALAIDCGWDVQVMRRRSGGPSTTARQRVLVVLQRGGDGRWRFARGFTQGGADA